MDHYRNTGERLHKFVKFHFFVKLMTTRALYGDFLKFRAFKLICVFLFSERDKPITIKILTY